jgi:hypothetical protein
MLKVRILILMVIISCKDTSYDSNKTNISQIVSCDYKFTTGEPTKREFEYDTSIQWKSLNNNEELFVSNFIGLAFKISYNYQDTQYHFDVFDSTLYYAEGTNYNKYYKRGEGQQMFFDKEKKYKDSIKIGNKIIKRFESQGFETISYLFTLWELIDSNKLKFISVLDKILLEGIGIVWIDTIVNDSNKTYIIGKSLGGDGGDMWGAVWVVKWVQPNKLEVVERIGWNYEASYEEQDPNPLDYKLNDNGRIIIQRMNIEGDKMLIVKEINLFDD